MEQAFDTLNAFIGLDKMIHNNGYVYFVTPIDTIKLYPFDEDYPNRFILSGNFENNHVPFKLPEIYIQLWSFMELCNCKSSAKRGIKWIDNFG